MTGSAPPPVVEQGPTGGGERGPGEHQLPAAASELKDRFRRAPHNQRWAGASTRLAPAYFACNDPEADWITDLKAGLEP